VFTVNLTCPAEVDAAAGGSTFIDSVMFLTEPGNEAPALTNGETPSDLWDYVLVPQDGDPASTAAGDGVYSDSSIPQSPFGQFGAWVGPAGSGSIAFDDILPNHQYSIGVACGLGNIDSLGFTNLIAGADGHVISAWSTITTDADKNWTLTGAVAPVSDTSLAITSATLAASTTGVDVSATVSKAGQTGAATDATGSVQFSEGGQAIGSPIAVHDGVASGTLTGIPQGDHSYTAVYTPDTAGALLYRASAPSAASATVTVPAPPANKTDSSLSLHGELIGADGATFTAIVQAAGATAADATGSVEFWSGGEKKGEGDISNGVATYVASGLTPGSHSYTAKYAGDVKYNASAESAPASVTVTAPAEPETLADGGTVKPGSKYKVEYGNGTFAAGATVTGEIHSDPITLDETAVADSDGAVVYTFTAPTSLVAGSSHELALTDGDTTETMSFTVAAAAADPTPTPTPTDPAPGSNNPVSFATDWMQGAVGTPGMAIGALIVVLLVAAGSGWFVLRRSRTNQ
jgi:hypothetical protein